MKIRTTKPGAGNKYFIRKANGGYSSCIQGKPTNKDCNVLANCVGYCCAAYNEEHEFGYEKFHLNCNAENFIERAIASGLSVYQDPMPGGIMVWQKGTLSSSDGAGHVALCTETNDPYKPTECKTSESGWGASTPFWRTTRKKGNGNWGQASTYKYRGCIAPVGYKPPTPSPSEEYIEIATPNGVWCRLNGYGFKYAKYKVIPYKTKCQLLAKNVGKVNGYNWDKIIYDGKTVYIPNKWCKYISEKKYIQLTTGVWCRTGGFGFKYPKYKVIPKNTKCELITKNIGNADGYNWDEVIYNGNTVYLPNNWNKYL